jgi:hypothetical protein
MPIARAYVAYSPSLRRIALLASNPSFEDLELDCWARGNQDMSKRNCAYATAMLLAIAGFETAVRAAPTAFKENWNATASSRFDILSASRTSAASNVADSTAADGKAIELDLGRRTSAGPNNGAAVHSKDGTFQYGTYTTRLKTADCSGQASAGVVSGFFTYFNDGVTDVNDNGVPDNSEIDIEWLCAKPQEIYLTMWTDYRDSDAAQKRVMRYIDLSTGTIKRTCYFEAFGFSNCQDLSGKEALPTTIPAMPDYQPHKQYYEYGFTWSATRVVWWIVGANGQKIILWDYQGPASRIPTNPAQYMTNIWHSPGWTPPDMPSAKQAPRKTISQFVDWTAFDSTLAFP